MNRTFVRFCFVHFYGADMTDNSNQPSDKEYRSDPEKLSYINLSNPIHLLGTAFGLSLKTLRPGTFTCLASIPLCIVFVSFCPWYLKLAVLMFMIPASVYICTSMLNLIGMSNKHRIVFDDFVGMLVTCFCLTQWYYVIIAFFTFRFVDMLKPWPISLMFGHLPAGVCVALDDVITGIYSMLVIMALQYVVFIPMMSTL